MSINNFNPIRTLKFKTKSKSKTKDPFLNNLHFRIKKSTGRSKKGSILTYNKGGGVLKKYRLINFYQKKKIYNIVRSIEKDPYRNSFIMLMQHKENSFSYEIAPSNIKINDKIVNFNHIGYIANLN